MSESECTSVSECLLCRVPCVCVCVCVCIFLCLVCLCLEVRIFLCRVLHVHVCLVSRVSCACRSAICLPSVRYSYVDWVDSVFSRIAPVWLPL
jgi:hypothetical protein